MRQGFGVGYGGGVNPGVRFPSYGGTNSYSATGGIQLESSVNVDKAFIQWGGLTAGRVQSFFDFYADNDNYHGMGDSDVTTQALAYTYTFGNGFSATLAIEDGIERRNVVASVGHCRGRQYLPERLHGRGLRELRDHLPGDRQPDLRFASGLPGRLQLLRHRAASEYA